MAAVRSAALAVIVAALAALAALAGVAALAACGARPHSRIAWPDAPEQLRDDADRGAAIDRLWLAPPGPGREAARAAIARAIAQRLADAVAADRSVAAAELLDELTALWQEEPAAVGAGLAPHAPLLGRLRALFAKAGALEPAVHALAVLAEVEPEARAAHLAELDEILEFADQLAIAEHGPDGRRTRPLALLQPAALAVPLPWLVDRYVALLVERQVAVAGLLAARGATLELVRAHADILGTTRRIAAVLARAGRPGEIAAPLARLAPGIGAAVEGRDRELRIAAELVAAEPTPDAYADLASRLRTGDRDADRDGDPAAALAVVRAGLARHPGDAELLAAAAGDARAIGRVDQAIAYYEAHSAAAARAGDEVDATSALRLGRLYGDRIARLAKGGRPRAAEAAWREAAAFAAGAARRRPHPVWQQTAALAESALGRGLASQGLLEGARRALATSLERAPSIDAFETLARIELQVGRFADAQRWARGGLALLEGATSGDRYYRARLERYAADALRRQGQRGRAAARYLEALRAWASLGEDRALPRAIAAERLFESGRAIWWLGDAARAVELVLRAVDAHPEGAEVAARAVAFLVEVGRYRDALDAFHRGLGEPDVHEVHKVYMCLWILGEARRIGAPRDRLAEEFLAERRGELWHERLAQAATGRLSFAALRAAAATGPQRSELAFYGAVLGLDPAAATPAGRRRLLEQAVAARIVLDPEYDLARAYLDGPGAPVARMQIDGPDRERRERREGARGGGGRGAGETRR